MSERNPDASPAPRTLAPWLGWSLFALVLAVTFLAGLFISSILERRREAVALPERVVPIGALEGDNAVWGKDYPREYAGWLATKDTGPHTKYGGGDKYDYLAADPALKALFAGYPFAVEYHQARGHRHALEDIRATARIDPARGGKRQPGTCMTCKSSDVPGLMQAMTPGKFYSAHFADLNAKVSHPIGCLDCHDPATMNLRISRPALREAFAAMGKNIDDATPQEMRSLVCAQCHVEYYFAKQAGETKKGTYLTFPWKNGLSIEAIETYYQRDVRHVDWVHPVSRTPMIKMQHPDYEIYTTGIHAEAGVACADCHMPYHSEGGVKYTDHKIQSPLQNIAGSCAVCHRWSEAETRARVYAIQDRQRELLDRAEAALAAAHREAGAAIAAGATDAQLAEARDLIRRAQMRWDFAAANNGMGFHSPQESARILATAIDLAGQARLAIARLRR